MKGLAKSSPFHLLTNPLVINRFIFGHGVVIYYIFVAKNSLHVYKKMSLKTFLVYVPRIDIFYENKVILPA